MGFGGPCDTPDDARLARPRSRSRTPELEPELLRWIETFRGPLIGLIASWGADFGLAGELAQDTFAEAWLGRGRFRGDVADDGAVGAWLRGIAWKLHGSARRKAERFQSMDGVHAEPEVERPAADPRTEALLEALAALPDDQATAVRMVYLERSSVRAAAALLEVPEKTIEGRLYRARRALKRFMNPDRRTRDERRRSRAPLRGGIARGVRAAGG